MNQQDDKIFALEEQIIALNNRINELSQQLKTHNHTGRDGSAEINSGIDITAKSFTATGVASYNNNLVNLPFVVSDTRNNNKRTQRIAAWGLSTIGEMGSTKEQVIGLLSAQKFIKESDINVASNSGKYADRGETALYVEQDPQGINNITSFVYSNSTPYAAGTGSVVEGGNTLTDSTASWTSNQLAGEQVVIIVGINIYSYKILSNTTNTITIDGTWEVSGGYTYQVYNPVYLGNYFYPFKRLYVGDDIRLGYGDSGGDQVRYIKVGRDVPTDKINGSQEDTLYIKTTAQSDGYSGWYIRNDSQWGPLYQASVEPSDTYKNTNATTPVYSTASAYTKLKEMQVLEDLDACRVKMGLHSGTTGTTVYCKLYVNNVPVGVEHSGAPTGWDYYTDDITGLKAGDKVQIYAHSDGVAQVGVLGPYLGYDKFIRYMFGYKIDNDITTEYEIKTTNLS